MLKKIAVCFLSAYSTGNKMSDKQHRWPRVWSVYFNFTTPCQSIYLRGYGGAHNTFGNSRRVGRLFLCSENRNSREMGGLTWNFLPWWGYRYFLKLHIRSTATPLMLQKLEIFTGLIDHLLVCRHYHYHTFFKIIVLDYLLGIVDDRGEINL